MVINIPISIDESAFEGKMTEEVKSEVIKELSNRIERELKEHDCESYYGRKRADLGLKYLINQRIDIAIEEQIPDLRERVIEATADRLATKLAKTKAAKELIK